MFSYSSQTTVRASNTYNDINAPFGGGYDGYGNLSRGVPNPAWLSSWLHRDGLRSVIEGAAMSLGHEWIPPVISNLRFGKLFDQYMRDEQIPIPLETTSIVPPPVVQPVVGLFSGCKKLLDDK